MASFTPCTGTGKNAVSIQQFPSVSSPTPGGGQTWSKSKTFGTCPDCARTVMSYGIVSSIKVNRHKSQSTEV